MNPLRCAVTFAVIFGALINFAVGQAPSYCPSSQLSNGQYSTVNAGCNSGDIQFDLYDCNGYISSYYNCNPTQCNCRECCCKIYCFGFCCETRCDTCYSQCPIYSYDTCRSCQKCKATKSPTKKPTRRPSKSPTKRPTRFPTKSPVPTPEPTLSPSRSPTLYPTKYPSLSPTLGPTVSPTEAPVPPTTPGPTLSPVPTPEPTPPTTSPTIGPTTSPTEQQFFSENNLMIFAAVLGGGGALSIAAFVVIYRRRRSTEKLTAAEELIEWKAKHEMGGDAHASLSNPLYGQDSKLPSAVPMHGRPDLSKQRMSLKGLNVHAWLQETKEEDRAKRDSVKKGLSKPIEPLKMRMKWDFEGANDDELSVTAGTVLLCLDQKDDWFVATDPLTGESGIVPSNYVVQHLDDDEF